jgi:hypothetical protein
MPVCDFTYQMRKQHRKSETHSKTSPMMVAQSVSEFICASKHMESGAITNKCAFTEGPSPSSVRADKSTPNNAQAYRLL